MDFVLVVLRIGAPLNTRQNRADKSLQARVRKSQIRSEISWGPAVAELLAFCQFSILAFGSLVGGCGRYLEARRAVGGQTPPGD